MNVQRKLQGIALKHRQRGKQEGFTLIELMIVVAIIAILAAIAIPLYLNYTARAQGSEALSLAGGLKPAIAEWYNTKGSFASVPANTVASNKLGVAVDTKITGKYVASVETGQNNAANRTDILVTYCTSDSTGCDVNSALSDKTITLSAYVPNQGDNEGSIEWVCWVSDSTGTALYKYVPSKCRHNSFADAIGTGTGT